MNHLMTGLKNQSRLCLVTRQLACFWNIGQPAGFNNLRNIFDVVFSICRRVPIHRLGYDNIGSQSASIIMTTLLINMRHMLMSASLSTYLKHACPHPFRLFYPSA